MGHCPRGCFITDEKVVVPKRGGTDPRGCFITDEKVVVPKRGGTDPRGCFITDEKVKLEGAILESKFEEALLGKLEPNL